MVELAPFRALLFTTRAPRVHPDGRYAAGALTRSDPDGSFRTAAETYRRWRREGMVVADSARTLWALEITSASGDEQLGLLGALRLDDDVVPHEAVDPQTLAARIARLRDLPLDISPISAYTERAIADIREGIEELRSSPAALAMHDADGTRFRLWRLPSLPGATSAERFGPALAGTRVIVADGHHRVHAARETTPPGIRPATLAFLIPHPPASRAVHRWLTAPPEIDIFVALERFFTLERLTTPDDLVRRLEASSAQTIFGLRTPRAGAFVLVPRDDEALRQHLPADRSPAWRSLDQTLWGFGVAPLLDGIASVPTTDAAAAVQRLEDDPDANCALILFRPIPTNLVTDLALASEPLPPKVTWFSPKPRTGLLLRPIRDDA